VGHVDLAGDLLERLVGLQPAHVGSGGVDRVDLSFVPIGLEVLDDDVADGQLLGGGADDRNRPGPEKRVQHLISPPRSVR
jgi:hypothetical protein